jgi:hypothetical protein
VTHLVKGEATETVALARMRLVACGRDVIVLLKTKGLFDEYRLGTTVLIWNYDCLLLGHERRRISNLIHYFNSKF